MRLLLKNIRWRDLSGSEVTEALPASERRDYRGGSGGVNGKLLLRMQFPESLPGDAGAVRLAAGKPFGIDLEAVQVLALHRFPFPEP
jgi:hypothetical protein